MASLLLGIAGAEIGGMMFGTGVVFAGMTGPAIGFAAGSMVGGMLFAPRPADTHTEVPRLADNPSQQSQYGNPIPLLKGSMRTPGEVIWQAPRVDTATTVTQESGGKGGQSASSSTTTWSYSQSFAVGFCAGTMAGVRRIWANKKLIFDARAEGPDYRSSAIADIAGITEVRFYPGSRTQTPDALIVANKGALCPAFRDLCYLVFDTVQLANYGNAIPLIEVELVESVSDDWRTTLAKPVADYDPVGSPGFRSYISGGGTPFTIFLDSETDTMVINEALIQYPDSDPTMTPRYWNVVCSEQINGPLLIGGFADGSAVTLVNNGVIVGMGGQCGSDGSRDGGDAIGIMGIAVTIDNSNGYIFGGGGGGGRGGAIGSAIYNHSGDDGGYASIDGGFAPAGAGPGWQDPEQETFGGAGNAAVFPPADLSLTGVTGTITGEHTTETIVQLTGDATIGGIDGITPIAGTGGAEFIVTGTISANSGAGGDGADDFAGTGCAGTEATCTNGEGPDDSTNIYPAGPGGVGGYAIRLYDGEFGPASVIWLDGNTPERVKGAIGGFE